MSNLDTIFRIPLSGGGLILLLLFPQALSRAQSPLERWLGMISMNRPEVESRPYEFLLQFWKFVAVLVPSDWWLSQDTGESGLMSDPQLSRTCSYCFKHLETGMILAAADVYSHWEFRVIFFSPRLHPIFIVADLWHWPLWVVGFYFPWSFWLAFLQQLGMLSILFRGGGLSLCFLFFFFFLP